MAMGAGMMGLPFQAAGSIMGAQAADQANQQNQQINEQNFLLQNQAIQNQIGAAYQQRRDALTQQTRDAMGASDSMGNHTYFDPVEGWKTMLSYMGKHQQEIADQLNTAQNQEKMTELSHDVPIERQQMDQAAEQNNQSASQADAFSRMLHDAILQGPDKSIGGQLYAAQSKGINDAYNAVQSDASRTAIRSGASNAGTALAELAKSRSDALSNASMQSMLQGREMAQDGYDKKIGGLSSLLQSFNQASRSPLNPAQYSPSNATSFGAQSEGALGALMQMFQASDPSSVGDPALQQAYGRFPQQDYVQPNYGDADAAMGIGGALSKAFGGGQGSGSSLLGGSGGGGLTNAFMGNSGVF